MRRRPVERIGDVAWLWDRSLAASSIVTTVAVYNAREYGSSRIRISSRKTPEVVRRKELEIRRVVRFYAFVNQPHDMLVKWSVDRVGRANVDDFGHTGASRAYLPRDSHIGGGRRLLTREVI